MINQEKIDKLWNNSTTVVGKDEKEWRKDACGAIVKYSEYGNRKSDYGWEIDHIVSKSYLSSLGASEDEIDREENLRILHWRNNDSKGTDYPEYKGAITSCDNINKLTDNYYTVNTKRQDILRIIYSKYGV